MNKQKVQIIILAAGKGSRMKSELPKPMHKIAGHTMLEMVLDNAQKVSDDIILVYSEAIKPYLYSYHKIKLILQSEPRGTGHAVYCASEAITFDNPIIVLYADNPFIGEDIINEMLEVFKNQKSDMMVMAFERQNPTGYGRLVLDDKNMLQKIIECKDASAEEKTITLCNSGVIIFHPKALKETLLKLMATKISDEYYLTSLVEIAYNNGYKTSYFTSAGAISVGVNTQEELKIAQSLVSFYKNP